MSGLIEEKIYTVVNHFEWLNLIILFSVKSQLYLILLIFKLKSSYETLFTALSLG